MRAGNCAWQLYKDLEHAVDAPITYRHTGAFWPAHTCDRMDLFHHLAGVSKSAGFDLAMLSTKEMEDKHPYYRAGSKVIGGIFDPYEGDIGVKVFQIRVFEHEQSFTKYTAVFYIELANGTHFG